MNEKKVKCLIVDDEIDINELVTLYLESMDFQFEIASAPNGDEALKFFLNHPDISLIISDIRMPGNLDGMQLASTLRAHTPSLKILLISGQSEYAEEDILAKGADIFLRKPFTLTGFREKVTQLVKDIL